MVNFSDDDRFTNAGQWRADSEISRRRFARRRDITYGADKLICMCSRSFRPQLNDAYVLTHDVFYHRKNSNIVQWLPQTMQLIRLLYIPT